MFKQLTQVKLASWEVQINTFRLLWLETRDNMLQMINLARSLNPELAAELKKVDDIMTNAHHLSLPRGEREELR